MKKIFRVIPSLDCTDLKRAVRLVEQVGASDMVYGYKIGFALGLACGIPETVRAIKAVSNKPIIYDHQKGGTDIPDTAPLFADVMSQGGVDEAILFPLTGPETMKAWIAALKERSIKVIVGSIMTHKGYLMSEGGFIPDAAVKTIFETAIREGVNSFVVPLTKPEKTEELIAHCTFNPHTEFYSPGLGHQKGDAARFGFIKRHYLIVGRSLLNADDPLKWIQSLERDLNTII